MEGEEESTEGIEGPGESGEEAGGRDRNTMAFERLQVVGWSKGTPADNWIDRRRP
jgi:hypothetical protein